MAVAYHLHNACEATSNSIDAWAVGVSVAVGAVASICAVKKDKDEREKICRVQQRMRE
ncbi:MAG TPA: hypothetical protein VGN07_16075 [Steroidobacteraceae bacterium]|jgi:hypothetical protein